MEYPEQLHIDYAKDAYRASNKCDYVEQMALWLQCQEAIHHMTTYHTWRQLKKSGSMAAIHGDSGRGDDDSDAGSDVSDGAGDDVDHRPARQPSGM